MNGETSESEGLENGDELVLARVKFKSKSKVCLALVNFWQHEYVASGRPEAVEQLLTSLLRSIHFAGNE